jgi:hypothetical protein
MKTVTLLFIISFLFGCSTTRTYWAGWQNWSKWEPTGRAESQAVTVTSKPKGASVYVDGAFMGDTPITLSLSYPVLRSERKKYRYEQFKPGMVASILGTRSSHSVISSKKQERCKPDGKSYLVEVRKQGYSLARKRISVPETSRVSFLLKRKPTLLIQKFKVKNNIKLSFFEKLYELLYENRFSVNPAKLEGIEKRFFTSRKVGEVFKTTTSQKADYVLKVKIEAGKELIEIKAEITDKSGILVTQRKTSLKTKDVNRLGQEAERLICSIIDRYIEINY